LTGNGRLWRLKSVPKLSKPKKWGGKGQSHSSSKVHVEDIEDVQKELWIKRQARFEKGHFFHVKDYEDALHFTF
jgi:hypothetical protein